MAMSTGRTFDIEDGSGRLPYTNLNSQNYVQVTLIQKQIPNMSLEDNVSESDPDWDNQIEFGYLYEQTL